MCVCVCDKYVVCKLMYMRLCENSVRNKNPKSLQVVQASLCVCVHVCVYVCVCMCVCVCVCVCVCDENGT